MTISAHAVPRWFTERRYGMFVHANIASVPAFSPVHHYSDWYWSHWSETPLPDVILAPPSPLPEVAAFHREHFPEVRAFDDFIPALTYDRWDADGVANLAVDAGMRYLVHVTKHHDGFCWWDSAFTQRNSARMGPKRDVVAELADATRRAGLVFGTYYSLLDWWHPDYPDAERYVDAYMRPQIGELVERFQPAVIWGDGQWGHSGRHWRADAIVEDYYAAMDRLGAEAAVNDRFNASHADFVTYEYDVPETPPAGPWELCRGIGSSFCVNRAEEDDDHLSATELVGLLTETVAKGGNLLVNIGPNADGTVPEVQERVLRESGEWVRAHGDLIHGSRPFGDWGDATTRFVIGADDAVWAIDLTNAPERRFGALTGVRAVTGAAEWVERDDGLQVRRDPAAPTGIATVYRVDAPERERIPVRADGPDDAELAARVEAARAGDVIEVASGVHRVHGLTVPESVTLRGSGDAILDGGGRPVLNLSAGSALRRLTVRNGGPGMMFIPATCVTATGDGVEIRDCHLEAVQLGGGSGHVLEGNEIAGGNVWSFGADQLTVRANRVHGLRWGPSLDVIGGSGHVIEDNDLFDDLLPIRLTGVTGGVVRANRCRGRWWGILVRHSSGVTVADNEITRTARAVCIEGGRDQAVTGNRAFRCDTGVLVEQGATHTVVEVNVLERCRVGILLWDEDATILRDNAITASRDHDVITKSGVPA